MRKVPDGRLRSADFNLGRPLAALLSERYRVRVRMSSNPMAFVMRAYCQLAAFRIGELFSDHEEGRLDAAFAENVKNLCSDDRLWSIVECQRQVEQARTPQVAGFVAPEAISSAALWPARVPLCEITALRHHSRFTGSATTPNRSAPYTTAPA